MYVYNFILTTGIQQYMYLYNFIFTTEIQQCMYITLFSTQKYNNVCV